MRCLVVASVLVSGCAAFLPDPDTGGGEPPADWFDPTFKRRVPIIATNPTDVALDGFPVPVILSDLGSRVDDDGAGLLAVDADNQATIPFEVERWDREGDSLVWVRFAVLAPGENLAWIYFDEDEPRLERSRGAETFNGFISTYHFSDSFGAADPIEDSAGGNDLGTLFNMDSVDDRADGTFAGALGFDRSMTEFVESSNEIIEFRVEDNQARLFEVWFRARPTTDPGLYAIFDNQFGCIGSSLKIAGDGRLLAQFGYLDEDPCNPGSSFAELVTPEPVDDASWHYAAMIVDRDPGPLLSLALDGKPVDQTDLSMTMDVQANETFRVGDDSGRSTTGTAAETFDGEIDELRVSTPPADAQAWIETTYFHGTEAGLVEVGDDERL